MSCHGAAMSHIFRGMGEGGIMLHFYTFQNVHFCFQEPPTLTKGSPYVASCSIAD